MLLLKLDSENEMIQSQVSKLKTLVTALFVVTLSAGGLVACSKTQSAQALVSEARQFQQKGDYKAAVIQLKNALQKDPNDIEARYLLGSIYNETGDPQSAEKEIRKALSLGMDPVQASSGLGKALLLQGQFQKVLDETKQASEAKNDAGMSVLRGNAYLALGKSEEAKASFEQALGIKADFPDALIGLARHALTKNDIESATHFSEQAVSKNPANTDAWFFKGDLLRFQGKLEPALSAYDQVLKLDAGNSAAHITKANLEIGMKKFDAAKQDIDAARKLAPNGLIVFYTQALLDFNQGNHAAALESLQQVLRAAPEHMPSLLLAGSVQLVLGSAVQAERHLKKYLEKNPGSLYARKLLATALLKNRQAQQALDVLAPALKGAQQDAHLLALAGEASMQTKNFAKATEYFEQASKLAPEAAQLHIALGMSRLGQGEDARAIAELEKAASMDTKSSQADILLVSTHLQHKEYDKALAAIMTLEKEQPDNPLVHNFKGGAYLGKKDIPNARASFEKALTLQPTYFPAVQNLAQLDMLENKPDAAKKRFENLLAIDQKNIQAMTALAGIALSQGQKKEATVLLERASNENPDALQPARLLAAHYLLLGEKQKSLNLARKLLVANPSNPDVLDLLAQAQLADGDKQGALESYSKLVSLNPASAPAQFRMASIYMSMQNQPAASDALKKALALQPDYLEAQLAVASLEAGKGNFDQSLAIARRIQKQHGKSPAGFELEGNLLMAQKKPDLAVKAYEQAFSIGKNASLMMKLHGALTQAGKGKEGDTRLLQWLKERPADLSVRMYLAGTYLAGKQNKAAMEQYQIVLKQDSKYVPALNNLAWLYQQEKDLPRALEFAEKANQLAPDSSAILDTLGWILVEQGNTARGLPLLQKAITLTPDAAGIHYHFILGLVKSGDKTKARKELEQLLATGKTFSQIEEAKSLLKQL